MQTDTTLATPEYSLSVLDATQEVTLLSNKMASCLSGEKKDYVGLSSYSVMLRNANRNPRTHTTLEIGFPEDDKG